MIRKIAIGLAAVTIATASSTLTASALPGGGTLGVANSGGDGFTTVGFGRSGFWFGRGFCFHPGFGPPAVPLPPGFRPRFGFHLPPAPSPSLAAFGLGFALPPGL